MLMSACAPQVQPVNPATELPKLTASAFYTADGAKLPLRRWLPAGKPKAIILALHGFNDYSRAFDYSGAFFKARGVAVYAYDQRGFGAAPQTGIWAGEENLIRDVEQCVAALHKRYPKTPLFILGESMGGAVAMVALTKIPSPLVGEGGDPALVAGARVGGISPTKDTPHPSPPPQGGREISGLILSAPAVWGGSAMGPAYHAMAWAMAHTMPSYTLTGEDLRIQASDNIPMLRALSRDPLVIKATRADTIYGLVQLMGDAYEKAPEVSVPTLLLYGDRDEVIPRAPVESMAKNFRAPLTVHYYAEGYHMLLRDLQRERVMQDIERWMQGK